MADLASALLGGMKRKKFHELLAEQASSTAPAAGLGGAIARALQGGLAGIYERGDRDTDAAEFDKLMPGAPAQPTPQALAAALNPTPETPPPADPRAITSGPRPASAPPLTTMGAALLPPPPAASAAPANFADRFDAVNGARAPQPQQQPPAQGPVRVASADPRGFRNNNPLNIEAGQFTQRQPGFQGSDGRFARFETMDQGVGAAGNLLDVYSRQHGLNTVAGIIGRWAPANDGNNVSAYASHVARAMGVDPNAPLDMNNPQVKQGLIAAMARFENGRDLPPNAQPTQGPAPQQMAQAPAGGPPAGWQPAPREGDARQAGPSAATQPQQSGMGPAARTAPPIPAEIREQARRLWMSGERGAAAAILQPYMKPREEVRPLTDPRERARYGIQATDSNPYLLHPNGDVKPLNPQPFNVNVNNQQESEFAKRAGHLNAERYHEYVKGGLEARQLGADLHALRDIGGRVTTGKIAEMRAALGPYAEAVGIKIDDLSDLQAYNSIIERMAPRMRPPGSGATSDFEMRGFLKSLPTIGNTPEGNRLINNTFQALQDHRIAVAEIASQSLSGDITHREAERQIRALPDPMELWRKNRGSLPTDSPTRTTPPPGGGNDWMDAGDGVRIRRRQ